MKPDEKQMFDLLEKLIEGELSADEGSRLDELVSGDPELRRIYLESTYQNACLHNTVAGLGFGASHSDKPHRLRFSLSWVCLATGVTIFLLGVALLKTLVIPGSPDTPIATLTKTKDCTWGASSLPTIEGTLLTAGKMSLATGVASVDFRSGAKVVLEAPAELELVDAMRCILHHGTLIATVPSEAIGFTVETATARLFDLGTEFAVNCDRNQGSTSVEVFEGEVDVEHLSSGSHQRLLTGQSSLIKSDGFQVFEHVRYESGSESPGKSGFGPEAIGITTAQGDGQDCYIGSFYPDRPQTDDYLLVKNPVMSERHHRKAYLSFDLSSLQGKKIARGRIQLQIMRSGNGYASWVPDAVFAVYGVTDESLDFWDKNSLTWNNAPANNPRGSSLNMDKVSCLGRFEVAQGQFSGLASKGGQLLTDFLNSDSNGLVTLIIIRETKEIHKGGTIHAFAGSTHPGGIAPTLFVELEK